MEPLSGLDASFLYLETESQPLHVCALFVLDIDSIPGGYDFQRFRSALHQRVRHRPEFRRLLREVPLRLGHPVWTLQRDVPIERHVHRHAVPEPGGERELAELCGQLAGPVLEREHPLWEMHVIEGLAGGRVAVFAKFHHAVVDGVAAANLVAYLCDLSPEAQGPAGEPHEPEQPAGERSLLARGVRTALRWPWEFTRLAWQTLPIVPDWIGRWARGEGMPLPFTAPRVSFNRPITAQRAVAYTHVPLDEVKRVKNAFGCTVNDVVLAMVAGALREYLMARDELPDRPLVAMVPVAVRDDRSSPGTNKVTGLFSLLPAQLADPVERLRAVVRSNRIAKQQHESIDAYMLYDWARLSLNTVLGAAAALYARYGMANWHPVVYNVLVSNVAGPPMPLYLAGARIVGLYPFGPVFHGVGLNITVASYAGDVNVGLMACASLVPHPAELAAAMPAALAELTAASEAVTA